MIMLKHVNIFLSIMANQSRNQGSTLTSFFCNHIVQASIATFLSILLLLSAWHLNQNINRERLDYRNAIQFVEASATLGKASDYLTAEARAFSVTQNVKHLNNYWNEVNATKRRDGAVDTLKRLNGDQALLDLLVKSKANSDALIQTELQSMRAVMEASGTPVAEMPQPVAQYTLPEEVKKLSKQGKIEHAQKIMFDQKYYDDKRSIMDPLSAFTALVDKSIEEQLIEQKNNVSHLVMTIMGLSILLLAVSASMFCVQKSPSRKSRR